MTTVRIIPIKPKRDLFNVKAYRDAIENAGNESSLAVQADFLVTTVTWNHKPDFKITHAAGQMEWTISTDDKIYGYLDQGTKVRRALMSKDFRPKSRSGWIGSNKGRGGVVFISKRIARPGIKARKFAKTIKKKWDKEWPRQLNRAIAAAVQFGGK